MGVLLKWAEFTDLQFRRSNIQANPFVQNISMSNCETLHLDRMSTSLKNPGNPGIGTQRLKAPEIPRNYSRTPGIFVLHSDSSLTEDARTKRGFQEEFVPPSCSEIWWEICYPSRSGRQEKNCVRVLSFLLANSKKY